MADAYASWARPRAARRLAIASAMLGVAALSLVVNAAITGQVLWWLTAVVTLATGGACVFTTEVPPRTRWLLSITGGFLLSGGCGGLLAASGHGRSVIEAFLGAGIFGCVAGPLLHSLVDGPRGARAAGDLDLIGQIERRTGLWLLGASFTCAFVSLVTPTFVPVHLVLLAAGDGLIIVAVFRSASRLRWLTEVLAGKIDGWRLGALGKDVSIWAPSFLGLPELTAAYALEHVEPERAGYRAMGARTTAVALVPELTAARKATRGRAARTLLLALGLSAPLALYALAHVHASASSLDGGMPR
jgi:hypothetical protein